MDDYNCCDYERTVTLEHLAEKYGTDKLAHGYIPFYEKHLPSAPKRILEIGCLTGASLRMWREWFPDTEIHCLDLFEEHQPPEDIPGVIYWKGNQTDQYVLEQLRRLRFDVAIDDGSHCAIDQVVTLFSLIGNCDLYVCEDIHCPREEFYRQGLPYIYSIPGMLEYGSFPFRSLDRNDKIVFIQKWEV